jgi:hypothetical protein
MSGATARAHRLGEAHAALQVEAETRPLAWVHAELAEQPVGGTGRLLEVLDGRLDVACALLEVAVQVEPRLDAAHAGEGSSRELDRRLVGSGHVAVLVAHGRGRRERVAQLEHDLGDRQGCSRRTATDSRRLRSSSARAVSRMSNPTRHRSAERNPANVYRQVSP